MYDRSPMSSYSDQIADTQTLVKHQLSQIKLLANDNQLKAQ